MYRYVLPWIDSLAPEIIAKYENLYLFVSKSICLYAHVYMLKWYVSHSVCLDEVVLTMLRVHWAARLIVLFHGWMFAGMGG